MLIQQLLQCFLQRKQRSDRYLSRFSVPKKGLRGTKLDLSRGYRCRKSNNAEWCYREVTWKLMFDYLFFSSTCVVILHHIYWNIYSSPSRIYNFGVFFFFNFIRLVIFYLRIRRNRNKTYRLSRLAKGRYLLVFAYVLNWTWLSKTIMCRIKCCQHIKRILLKSSFEVEKIIIKNIIHLAWSILNSVFDNMRLYLNNVTRKTKLHI